MANGVWGWETPLRLVPWKMPRSELRGSSLRGEKARMKISLPICTFFQRKSHLRILAMPIYHDELESFFVFHLSGLALAPYV